MGVARYDAVAEFYDGLHGTGVGDPATSGLLDLAGDVSGRRVLDLACGQGRVARELARRGAAVVGVDLSTALVQLALDSEAAEALGVTYLVGNAATAGLLRLEAFDLVVCNMSITDLDDLSGVVVAASRSLVRGGAFVASMLHPCYPGSGDWSPAWPPEGYFAERFWNTGGGGIRGKVGANHRALSTVLNTLIGAGLRLEALREPVWPSSERGPRNGEVPGFLVVRATRDGG